MWTCGPSARVLDLSNNSIQDVPAAIGCLSSIQVLKLSFTFSLICLPQKWNQVVNVPYFYFLNCRVEIAS